MLAASERLRDAVVRYDVDELGRLLREAVPEFAPSEELQPPATATVVAFPARQSRKIR